MKNNIQVIISTHNVQSFIFQSLLSVEKALLGYNWILIIADDNSSDDTPEWIKNHKTTAQKFIFKQFPKSQTVSMAKNRAIELGREFRAEYPIICLMDGDDIMGKDRINHLLPHINNETKIVAGDYKKVGSDFDDFGKVVKANDYSQYFTNFGPWTTLFHADLIPEDGKLFREDLENCEDSYWYLELLTKNIKIKPVGGNIIHYYNKRKNGLANPNEKDAPDIFQKWNAAKYELLGNKRIDLNNKLDFSIIMSFDDTSAVNEIGKIYDNLSFLVEFIDYEIILLDYTAGHWFDMIKIPFCKELCFGFLKYIQCHNLSEQEIKTKIKEVSTTDKIVFLENNKVLTFFDINSILETKQPIKLFDKFGVFSRENI